MSGPLTAANAEPKEDLFAVLQPGGDLLTASNDAVAIAGPDGRVRATAHFTPRAKPVIGNAAPILQPEARVAAGQVFFADAAGAVRSLSPDGTVRDVTTFPITNPQQELSFAVSPDGKRLMAVVLSFPPLKSPLPEEPLVEGIFAPGEFREEAFAAAPGRPAISLGVRTWPQSQYPADALEMVGWSATSPLATIDTVLGTQSEVGGRRIFGSVAELNQAARPGQVVGGSDCKAWAVLSDETVLCAAADHRSASLRTRAGRVLLALPAVPAGYDDLTLSPDGQRLTYESLAANRGDLGRRGGGPTVHLPEGFHAEGWLDSSTIIGVSSESAGFSDLETVQVANPGQVRSLGFTGYFVGVLQVLQAGRHVHDQVIFG